MHAMLVTVLLLPALLVTTRPARSDETPVADPPAVKNQEFKPPAGFWPKKRGQFVVYCRREDVMGSRAVAQKCYDEQGIRDLLQSQREDREKIDQLRRIGSSMGTPGG